MAVERLQKILSNAGVASRRSAEQMIAQGRVAVNGQVVDQPGGRADPEVDEITLDGVPVLRGRYRYLMLNKPRGYVTTARDELGRETVVDLVPMAGVKLHPVGRLDRESEGLLLLTNDGHLTALLTHPRHQVEKEYLVGLDSPLPARDLARLVRGISVDGERLRATSARPAAAPEGSDSPAASWLLLALREGRKREIRRMLAAVDRHVVVLRRVRVGPLHLGSLAPGAFRELSADEVQSLYAAAVPAPGGPASPR